MQKFLKSFSTVSILAYILAILVVIAMCRNPFCQMIIVICLVAILLCADKSRVKASIQLALWIGVPILIINPLVNQSGATILFSIIDVPLFGRIDITLESIVFAVCLMFKLMNTVLVFCIFNLLIHPDKLLNLVSCTLGKSALIITITTRLIPSLLNRLHEIADIQKTRGAVLEARNPFQRVKAWYPFAKIILFSSLENSYGIAEAIQSKGYGRTKRTVFYNEKVRPRDMLLIGNSALFLIFILVNQALFIMLAAELIVFPVILYRLSIAKDPPVLPNRERKVMLWGQKKFGQDKL